MGARWHLAAQPVPRGARQDCWCRSHEAGVVARTVQLRAGREVMVICAYARHGCVGGVLSAVAELTGFGKRPFLLLADFNQRPDELGMDDWLGRARAHVVLPTVKRRTAQTRNHPFLSPLQ